LNSLDKLAIPPSQFQSQLPSDHDFEQQEEKKEE